MQTTKQGIFTLLLCTVIFSCKDTGSSFLNQALQLSDSNRPQLEQVLAHYKEHSDDSLKLRAAEFLISNMSAHFSYSGDEMEAYYDTSDSISALHADKSAEEIRCAFNTIKKTDNPKIIHDLHSIPADYLIYSIDRAFDAWQTSRYAQHLTFDDFCEYLLPYKVCELQTIDNWRDYLLSPEYGDLSDMQYCYEINNSAFAACDLISLALKEQQPTADSETSTPKIRRISSLLKTLKHKDCDDIAVEAAAVMRAKGIPAAIDFTPVWADSHTGHVWVSVKDNGGKTCVFDGYASPRHLKTTSKVFRNTYTINLELLNMNNNGIKIPPRINSICVKDVTDEYFDTEDLDIKITKTGAKYIYLATFNDQDWEPVMWGKVSGNKAHFNKMGRGVVYLPVAAENNGLKPVANPFILNLRGEIEEIMPQKQGESAPAKRQTLKLYRKHPPHPVFYSIAKLTAGDLFEASNKPDFSDATVIHKVNKFATESDVINVNPDHKFRYWRYQASNTEWGGIAEMIFYQNGQNITQQGKIIGAKHDNYNDGTGKENITDNDGSTFWAASPPDNRWAGFDFGHPVRIDKILYIPRSDGNGIIPGDEYELRYWDCSGWQTVGKKIADDIFVEYDNCPAGSLFLLHNCTRGTEERIFTYHNGKQHWW
ncbi:MAG: discoidin domain-containing protein [Dysgonamonadaceae bacterium]|jgi:hypothetical protein|nr:discoidin domain-containing protein [Dysgonamonadaceae bacterium]